MFVFRYRHARSRSLRVLWQRNVVCAETPAYQLLLGNTLKPSAPEKSAVFDHRSESSTDIEKEVAAAVTTNQSKARYFPFDSTCPRCAAYIGGALFGLPITCQESVIARQEKMHRVCVLRCVVLSCVAL